MKRLNVLALLLLTTIITVKGQQGELIWPALTPFKKLSWKDSVYVFTQFQSGKLIFDTGFKSPQSHVLNYNLFTEEMIEVTSKGDTVLFDIPNVPHTVLMGGYEFEYFQKRGYMRVLARGRVSLAVREYFISGYLQGTVTSGYLLSAKNISKTNLLWYPLGVDNRREDFELFRSYLKRSDCYFIVDREYSRATEANLINAYKDNSAIVKFYLEKHKVDFDNAESLKNMIHVLNDSIMEHIDSRSFRVSAGELITKHWRDSVYALPTFSKAIFQPSSQSDVKKSLLTNYNLVTGKMDYINNNGDTVQLNDKNISTVTLDDRSFYKQADGSFAELLSQGKVSFFEVKRLKVMPIAQQYDAPITSVTAMTFDKYLSRDRLCINETSLYLQDKFQRLLTVDKDTMIKFFPGARKEINEYSIKHNVNYRNKREVLDLINFCQRFTRNTAL